MIRIISIIVLFMGVFLFSDAQAVSASICDSCGCKSCVAAFYFHTNMRCATCKTIEQYTKETVEASFKDELADRKLCFRVINTEEKGNEHFMQDYQLYTKAVVLSLVKNDKEVKFTNLTKIWELTQNEDAFKKYVASEISKYLKEL
ncbi:MAG TPA: nitrophenyl compound nitroreductase subunit ArsF family protein [Candidatus Omnitrophota bacterium]|nr:nitrophenyl compound nitroreductase subunit ArsF family protein [Candidatus Omnitrophota bacterium]